MSQTAEPLDGPVFIVGCALIGGCVAGGFILGVIVGWGLT